MRKTRGAVIGTGNIGTDLIAIDLTPAAVGPPGGAADPDAEHGLLCDPGGHRPGGGGRVGRADGGGGRGVRARLPAAHRPGLRRPIRFDVAQARSVVRALDTAGVPVIEVSHGDGLGGSSFNYGFSKVDELELLRVAVAEAKQALGAGAGNTPTEVLVAVCDRLGIPTGVETFATLAAAEEVVAPIMDRPQLVDRASLLLSYAGVYASFLLHAERAAERFQVDLPELLTEIGRRKIVGGQEDMIVDIAAELRARTK